MNSNPLLRIGLNYGSMSGLSLLLVFILLYFAGLNPIGGMSWLGAWIPIVFIALAIKNMRDQVLGGFISFGKAFRVGLITSFFSSLLFALVIYVFGKAIDHTIIDMYKNEILKSADEAKILLSDRMIDQVIEEAENVTMSAIAMNDFTAKMTGGIILSLIISAFLVKKEPADFG